MKLSELSALLAKAQQVAGDVEYVLEDASTKTQTVITDLGLHLDATTAQPTGKVTITHDIAPAAPTAVDTIAAEQTA